MRNQLISNNISYATITDTVDFEKETIPYILIKLKMRNDEIERINEKYEGKVKLLRGAEIISPHKYKSSTEALTSVRLDMVIGSIKELPELDTIDKRKIAYTYFKEILKMVKDNQINVVGHLGYLSNCIIEDYCDTYLLNDIFTVMKENNIVLEINANKKGLIRKSSVFPDIKILKLYKNRLDKVTLGTDAKNLEEITDNLNNAEYVTKVLELKPVIYKRRKQEKI